MTGDNRIGDGIAAYDNLAFPGNKQTITFTATVLDLSIAIVGNPRPAVGEIFSVELCIGADVEVSIRLSGRANNGRPTQIQVVGIVPIVPYTPPVIEVGTEGFETKDGCLFVDVIVTKSGGVRLVAELLNDSGGVVEVEEAIKVNIKPK